MIPLLSESAHIATLTSWTYEKDSVAPGAIEQINYDSIKTSRVDLSPAVQAYDSEILIDCQVFR